jgi:phosphate starvation-inducible PhoH-like protein
MEFSRESKVYLNFLPFAPFKYQGNPLHLFNPCNLKNPEYKIIIASGPAGTGKTLFGIEQGVRNYIMGNYEKLIFTRPVVSVDEDLGYLPGTVEDKIYPFLIPIYDYFLEHYTKENLKTLKI